MVLYQNLQEDSEPLKEDLVKLSGHSLLHYAITQAVQASHSITEVKNFARHGDISTTDRYIHEHHRADQWLHGYCCRAVWSSPGNGVTATTIMF